jgi:kumamolisin
MSPSAKIYLVEAASNGITDLLKAVDTATNLVSSAGGGIVSMSWGASEFSGQSSYDSHFQKSGVTYIASAGDAPGVSWPGTSQYVVAAGGTSVSRNPTTGNFAGEGTWQQAGGGISAYTPRPAYQKGLSSIVGNYRGVPDIAADADPNTGVWVYSGSNGGWNVVGGTSVSTVVLAGIISWKGIGSTGVQAVLNALYQGTFGNVRDITNGNCGPYAGWTAVPNWDPCTGLGSMLGANTVLAIATP